MIRVALDSQPFETYIAVFMFIVSFPLLIAGKAPRTLSDLLPEWVVHIWGAELFVGSLLILVGLFGSLFLIEELGLALVSSASIVYALALIVIGQGNAAVAATFCLAIGVACWHRKRNVRRTIVEFLDESKEVVLPKRDC